MKSLYKEDGTQSPDGQALSDEFREALKPVIDKYTMMGFPKREISYMITTGAHALCIYAEYDRRNAEADTF